jgi:hypothetical protein
MTIMRRWLVFGGAVGILGIGTAAFIAGCSSTSDPYPDADTFCSAKATAECTSGMTGGVAAACNVDPSDCISARQETCITAADMATANGQTYSPTGAVNCIAAIETAYATSPVDYSSIQAVEAACGQGTFPGLVATMGTCKTSAECASTADGGTQVCSPVNPGSTLLECATAIPVAANGQCADFGSVCAAGTYCLGSKDTPYECLAGAPVGGSCTVENGCAAGGFCVMNGDNPEGICQEAASQAGAACTSDVECGGGGPVGSTPTTNFPYCDFSVTPTMGTGPGACEPGQSFAPGGDDCRAFGAASQ